MIHLCWMTSHGWAEMVRTQEVISPEIPRQITREMLIDALNAKYVREQLRQYGLPKEEAVARINSLTDEEISSYWLEMVKTRKKVTRENLHPITRGMLIDALNREELQKQLEQYGISRAEAAVRINSLTDAEVAAIATEVGPLPSGGDHEDEEDFIFFLQIFLIVIFIAVILAAYILGVFFKGTYCIFADCEAKGGTSYVFRPWWLDLMDPPKEHNDQPTETNDSGDRLEGKH